MGLWVLLLIAALLIGGVFYYQKTYRYTIEAGLGDQVRVIDVSKWNRTISWKKVKKSDIYYAMLRIGRGADGDSSMAADSAFKKNYKSGKRYNIHMGVYFYSYAVTVKEAEAEADYCLSLLKKYGVDPEDLELPLAYDVEEKRIFKTGRKNVTAMTVAFLDKIRDAGYQPMLYASDSALIRYFKHSKIKDYQIWVAHYGVEESGPNYPYHFDMWQYTSKGIVPGANTSGKDNKGNCDINYYVIPED